jgi:hypothetical protein
VTKLDLNKVTKFAQSAETEDLLDRVTVYRDQTEPAALEVFEAELTRRGFDDEAILAHATNRNASSVVDSSGMAVRCSYCDRPAVERGWGWHRLWGRFPVVPRIVARCEVHKTAGREADEM